MNHSETNTKTSTKISIACPSGHRIRGGTELIGRTVRCPKCKIEFVFAAVKPESPPPPESHQVSDTGVMRILGEMTQEPAAPASNEVAHRPCSRCGVAVPESLTVCSHCNCYLGVMPTFMKQIGGRTPQEH